MNERIRNLVRWALALLLAALAWRVTRDYALLSAGEALFVAGMTLLAVIRRPRGGAWRFISAPLLALLLAGFWLILADRLADRNMVLVGVLTALTGLLTTGGED